jgi:hypothetical protein
MGPLSSRELVTFIHTHQTSVLQKAGNSQPFSPRIASRIAASKHILDRILRVILSGLSVLLGPFLLLFEFMAKVSSNSAIGSGMLFIR